MNKTKKSIMIIFLVENDERDRERQSFIYFHCYMRIKINEFFTGSNFSFSQRKEKNGKINL